MRSGLNRPAARMPSSSAWMCWLNAATLVMRLCPSGTILFNAISVVRYIEHACSIGNNGPFVKPAIPNRETDHDPQPFRRATARGQYPGGAAPIARALARRAVAAGGRVQVDAVADRAQPGQSDRGRGLAPGQRAGRAAGPVAGRRAPRPARHHHRGRPCDAVAAQPRRQVRAAHPGPDRAGRPVRVVRADGAARRPARIRGARAGLARAPDRAGRGPAGGALGHRRARPCRPTRRRAMSSTCRIRSRIRRPRSCTR